MTEFGDVKFLLPASCALFVALWIAVDREIAMSFALVTGVCVTGAALAKILFMTCRGVGGVYSPSGHTAFSVYFYGALALIAVSQTPAIAARLFAAACVALIALIAMSRVAIGGHTILEAVLGLVLGGVCVALFRRLLASHWRPPAALAAAIPLALTTALFAARLLRPGFEPEVVLHRLASWLRQQIGC